METPTQFRVHLISMSIDILVYQHAKCFIYLHILHKEDKGQARTRRQARNFVNLTNEFFCSGLLT